MEPCFVSWYIVPRCPPAVQLSPWCTFVQFIDLIVLTVFNWHTSSHAQGLRRCQSVFIAELLHCFTCIPCTSVVQRWSFRLVACRLTSSAPECSTTHVLINIIVGDTSWFRCAARTLSLVTKDVVINVLEDVGLHNEKVRVS